MFKLFSPSGYGIISRFLRHCHYRDRKGTLLAGTFNTEGRKILRFSTEVAVYLGNGTRQAHTFCGSVHVGCDDLE